MKVATHARGVATHSPVRPCDRFAGPVQRGEGMPRKLMKVISLNVGLPRDVNWHGRAVRTSIWKSPVEGRIRVVGFNLDGDRQSDLSVHGGERKAVYIYPSEHYEFWRQELPGMDLPWGSFGENFTTEGLLESDVRLGDRLGIGSAEFTVTQPRLPCYKLGIRFGNDGMVKRFLQSGRSGFYVAVVREGDVACGDLVAFTSRAAGGTTVEDDFRRRSLE